MTYDGTEISWVWLDLDDTLIDFKANARQALIRLYNTEGLNRFFASAEEWATIYESHNMALWNDYNMSLIDSSTLRLERFRRPLTQAGAETTEATELSKRFDPIYLDFLASEKRLVPGAVELLKALRNEGCKIGILSNGFKEVQPRKIKSAGLEPYVDLMVLSDDIGINKPDIRLYRYAMSQAGEAYPRRHLMIGDNPDTDIAGALNAGWNAIYFNRFNRPVNENISGARIVYNLSDIPSTLCLPKFICS